MPAETVAPSPSVERTGIRKARPSDIERLCAIEEEAFAADRLSRRSLKALLRRPSAILLVAARAGAIDGYALVLTRRGARAARLYSLAVHPAAAGRGIGSRLLDAAEAAAFASGADRLRLEVRPDNHAAIRLYERRGYRRIGRREPYYADGAPALRYERTLRQPERAVPRRPFRHAA
jgi:ribosomal protein S18 acetylase RimI-like enzyme